MSKPTGSDIGVQGWRQFLSAKQAILGHYDVARSRAASHEVQAFHGCVGEAAVREWLAHFLPKRYGITAGYIVSQGLPDTAPPKHFDIIIYDQLESPVLWVDSNPDASQQGVSKAILAEHVRAVVEVKSSFEPSTVAEAMAHLQELAPLLIEIDSPEVHYKKYLPKNFATFLVFIELRKGYEFSVAALDNILSSPLPRGFSQGVILRGEGLPMESTGTIQMIGWDAPQASTVGRDKNSLLSERSVSNSVETSSHHLTALLTWGSSQFSLFAFDLLALIRGSFRPGEMSSLHGSSCYGLTCEEVDTL